MSSSFVKITGLNAGIDSGFTKLSSLGETPASIQADPVAAASSWLAAVNPIFGAISASGSDLNIQLDKFALPLDGMDLSDITAGFSLSANDLTIELNDRVLPAPLLEVAKQALGGKTTFTTNIRPVALNIKDGQMGYDDLVVPLDNLNLVFSGRVSLDGGAALYNLSFSGEGAKQLQGLALTINRGADGSITIPEGQLQQMLVKAGLNAALGEALPGGLPGGLEKVIGGGGGDGEEVDPGEVIGGILGGLGNKRDKEKEKKEEKSPAPEGTIGQPRSDATPAPEEEEAEEEKPEDRLIRGVIGAVRKEAEKKE